jgi:hypothetical protein
MFSRLESAKADVQPHLIKPGFLGLKHRSWALFGKVVIVVGEGLAGIAGILAIAERSGR